MTRKDIILLVAAFAIAAAVDVGTKHPSHHPGYHHYPPYYHVPLHLDPETAPAIPVDRPELVQEDNAEEVGTQDLKSIQDNDEIEGDKDEIEGDNDEIEGDNDEIEDDSDQTEAGVGGLREFLERKFIPTKCDALSLPMYSCYNCYSYLVCKPEGGKIKACKDPYAPYCNNGICSATPSDSCSNL